MSGAALARVGLGTAAVVALAGIAALLVRQPLLFPSLGPTAMLFFQQPTAPSSSARHALVGHGVGLVVGLACVSASGLAGAGPVTEVGVSTARVVAATVSVAVTAALLTVLRSEHAPAGATTLIVSLGFITAPLDLLWMAASVLLLTAASVLLNRATGAPRPATR